MNEDYTLGQNASLEHMDNLGYYWKCPKFTQNKIVLTTQDAELQALMTKFKYDKLSDEIDVYEKQNLATIDNLRQQMIKIDSDYSEITKQIYYIENLFNPFYNFTMNNVEYIEKQINELSKYDKMTRKELIQANKTTNEEIKYVMGL